MQNKRDLKCTYIHFFFAFTDDTNGLWMWILMYSIKQVYLVKFEKCANLKWFNDLILSGQVHFRNLIFNLRVDRTDSRIRKIF